MSYDTWKCTNCGRAGGEKDAVGCYGGQCKIIYMTTGPEVFTPITGFEDEKYIAHLDGLIDKQQAEIAALTARIDALTKERDELKGQVQFYLDGCAKAEKISEAHINRAEKAEARVKELQAEVDKKQHSIETLYCDWADDDTAIKDVCKPFGIDTEGDSYGVPCMADCVIQLGEKAAAFQDRCARLETALREARGAIKNLGTELHLIAEASFEHFEEANSEKDAVCFGDIANTANFARTLYEDPALKVIDAALGTNDAPKANARSSSTPKPNEGQQ